jgi:hypothetical protein
MDKKQTKVKVVVRLRPLLKSEDKVCVFADGKSVVIFIIDIVPNFRWVFFQVHLWGDPIFFS